MPREHTEFERIERLVLKTSGDFAEALGRGLERLEDRIDAAEARIASHVAELGDGVSSQAVGSGY